MINEGEILMAIKNIRLKTELLANPLYNDAGGSKFWTDIDKKLEEIELSLDKELSYLEKYIY